MGALDGRTDGRMDGRTDGHNCNDIISIRHDHELNPSKIIFKILIFQVHNLVRISLSTLGCKPLAKSLWLANLSLPCKRTFATRLANST